MGQQCLNVDFLLGGLKRLLARRKDLKVVITSATIAAAAFADHFAGAPVVEVAGRGHPVEIVYRRKPRRGAQRSARGRVRARRPRPALAAAGSAGGRRPSARPVRGAAGRRHRQGTPPTRLAVGLRDVSAALDLAALARLDADALEWLVPGFLEEKCLALVRGLPKPLRRRLAPGRRTAFAPCCRDCWRAIAKGR